MVLSLGLSSLHHWLSNAMWLINETAFPVLVSISTCQPLMSISTIRGLILLFPWKLNNLCPEAENVLSNGSLPLCGFFGFQLFPCALCQADWWNVTSFIVKNTSYLWNDRNQENVFHHNQFLFWSGSPKCSGLFNKVDFHLKWYTKSWTNHSWTSQ